MKKNYRKNYHQQYRNDRPNPTTVTVNKRDYDVLVGKAMLLDNVKALIHNDKKYVALDVLETVFKN